ncbi:MAG: LytTR family DNA-binding domain-containing protein [Clostridiales bacterium]|nr:LytTR family DNA-binding domain-containing protein [Clostridiales bacterium]MDY4172648.1 LytTR family DNA-binding domain-containing protein [Evtepia sp.]
MLSVVICDDDRNATHYLHQLVSRCLYGSYQIHEFVFLKDLKHAVAEGLQVDIAVLDIQMSDGNGIQAARQLFSRSVQTQVIFVTGYVEYCSSVYETEHTYFLLKPVQPKLFRRAMEKAVENLSKQRERCLTVYTKTKIQRIPLSSVRYIESQARKVVIHCQEEQVACYTTLAALLPQLSAEFVHCHKSFCVNMGAVRHMDIKDFVLDRGEVIPISQTKRSKTKKCFLEYVSHGV